MPLLIVYEPPINKHSITDIFYVATEQSKYLKDDYIGREEKERECKVPTHLTLPGSLKVLHCVGVIRANVYYP